MAFYVASETGRTINADKPPAGTSADDGGSSSEAPASGGDPKAASPLERRLPLLPGVARTIDGAAAGGAVCFLCGTAQTGCTSSELPAHPWHPWFRLQAWRRPPALRRRRQAARGAAAGLGGESPSVGVHPTCRHTVQPLVSHQTNLAAPLLLAIASVCSFATTCYVAPASSLGTFPAPASHPCISPTPASTLQIPLPVTTARPRPATAAAATRPPSAHGVPRASAGIGSVDRNEACRQSLTDRLRECRRLRASISHPADSAGAG